MSELTDRSIASLRTHHDLLAALVGDLSAEQLAGPSGASEWSVGQVLSHLGSGSEIMLTPIRAALGDAGSGAPDNQAVWARWDAMTPEEQAAGFLEHDETLVSALESIGAEERDTVRVDLGFLPEPVGLETAVALRLNEVLAHTWDARVAVDPEAEVDAEGAEVLAALFAGPASFFLGFVGKSDAIEEPATVALDGYAIVVHDGVKLEAGRPLAPTATFEGSLPTAVRMLTGRLRPEHTPAGVSVTGNVSLEDLRTVFPGF